jgi:hypothetical protein
MKQHAAILTEKEFCFFMWLFFCSIHPSAFRLSPEEAGTRPALEKRKRSALYFSPADSVNITENRERGVRASLPLCPLSSPLPSTRAGEDAESSRATRERRRWSTCSASATLPAQPRRGRVSTFSLRSGGAAPLPQCCTAAKDEAPQHGQAVLPHADHPHLHPHLLPFGRQIDGDGVVRWGQRDHELGLEPQRNLVLVVTGQPVELDAEPEVPVAGGHRRGRGAREISRTPRLADPSVRPLFSLRPPPPPQLPPRRTSRRTSSTSCCALRRR